MRTFLTGLIFILVSTFSVIAQDARNCGDRQVVIEALADRYGESQQSIGLGTNNSVMELYANSDTGTWTILVTLPNGVSCLVASGQAYEYTNLPLIQGELN